MPAPMTDYQIVIQRMEHGARQIFLQCLFGISRKLKMLHHVVNMEKKNCQLTELRERETEKKSCVKK